MKRFYAKVFRCRHTSIKLFQDNDETSDPDVVKNIQWMTYEQFTVELGKEKIKEFVEVPLLLMDETLLKSWN